MLVRQQWLDLRMVQKPGHELREHIAVLQPFPILGEGGRVPDRIVRRQSYERAIQKIVVQLLHRLAFRAWRLTPDSTLPRTRPLREHWRVCIPNRPSKSPERKREQKKRWFRDGQKWRTGCEGRISVVKRRNGLNRCRYKGDAGMQRWVALGVISDNLVNIGRTMSSRADP